MKNLLLPLLFLFVLSCQNKPKESTLAKPEPEKTNQEKYQDYVKAHSNNPLSHSDTINFIVGDMKQGYWREYNHSLHRLGYSDNQLVTEGVYIDGKKNGPWKEYFPNNRLKSKITYENDQPVGEAIYYDETGKISKKGIYKAGAFIEEKK